MTSPTIRTMSGDTASAPMALRDRVLAGAAVAGVAEHHEAEDVGLGRAEREVDRPRRPGEEAPARVHPVGVARAGAQGRDHGLVAGGDSRRRDDLARRVVVEVPAHAPVGGGLRVPDDGDAGLRVLEVGAARQGAHRLRGAAASRRGAGDRSAASGWTGLPRSPPPAGAPGGRPPARSLPAENIGPTTPARSSPARLLQQGGCRGRRPTSRLFLARCAGVRRPAGPGASRFRTEHSRFRPISGRGRRSRARRSRPARRPPRPRTARS